MRLHGRRSSLSLALCLLCLLLWPGTAAAAPLTGLLAPGTYQFTGEFDADNEVAFFSFSVAVTSPVTIDLTSHLCGASGDPCGFLPILTLFQGVIPNSSTYLADLTFFDGSITTVPWLTLDSGSYVLAVTVYENYYDVDAEAFLYATHPGFTNELFDPNGSLQCAGFPQPGPTAVECRLGLFAGSLTIEGPAAPTPTALSLFSLGTAIFFAHRRGGNRKEE